MVEIRFCRRNGAAGFLFPGHERNDHIAVQSKTSDRACSDEQLLNEDSGWGAYLEGRQQRGASGAAIPRPADPADLPSSYAESITSPAQPSPQASDCRLSSGCSSLGWEIEDARCSAHSATPHLKGV